MSQKPEKFTPSSPATRQNGHQQSTIPAHSNLPVPVDLPLVNRVHELAIMRSYLHAWQEGQSNILLLDGDAGIGKSRLLRAFLDLCQDMRLPIWEGHGQPVARQTPYHAWKEILRQVTPTAREMAANPVWTAHRSLLPLLNGILPVRLEENDITHTLTGESRATVIRATLAELLLDAMPASSGIIIAFDDVQWLDSASWALLHRLRQNPRPLLILLTTQTTELATIQQQELQNLVAQPTTIRLHLRPLSAKDTENLVGQRLGVPSLPGELADFVYERTNGHPFFSLEMTHALLDNGIVSVDDKTLALAYDAAQFTDWQIPKSLQEVVIGRIRKLSAPLQQTLQIASVLGRQFSLGDLEEVYPLPNHRLLLRSFLDKLIFLDFLQQQPTVGGTSQHYSFNHLIVRDIAYDLVDPELRRKVHLAIAQLFESRFVPNDLHLANLLAHHWQQAEQVGRALHYLGLAGEVAFADYANAEAVSFLSQALALDAKQGFICRTEQRAAWELILGQANVLWTRYEDGKIHLEEGLRLLDQALPVNRGSVRTMFHVVRAIVQQAYHQLRPGRIDMASNELEKSRLIAASQACSRLVEVVYHGGEPLKATYLAFHALNLAERAGPSPELAEAYGPAGSFYSFIQYHRPARQYFARALRLARQLESASALAYCLVVVSTYESGLGHWTQARILLRRLDRLSRQRQIGRRSLDATQIMSLLDCLQHQAAGCLLRGKLVLDQAQRLDDRRFEGYGHFARAYGHFLDGDLVKCDQSLATVQRLLADGSSGIQDTHLAHNCYGLKTLSDLRQGKLTQARRAATEAERFQGGAYQVSYYTLPGYVGPVELHLTLWQEGHGDQAELKRRTRAALWALRLYALTFPIGRPALHLYRGWYHQLCGNQGRAERCWQRGLYWAEKLAMPYEAAFIRELWGKSLGYGSATGRSYLLEAAAGYKALSCWFELKRVQQRLRSDARG